MSDNPVFSDIQEILRANDVVLFMKGSPAVPLCGFSASVVKVLGALGVAFAGIDVLERDDLRQALKDFSNWPTFPQLYVKGELIGGCDIVREMMKTGELQQTLKDKGVAFAQETA